MRHLTLALLLLAGCGRSRTPVVSHFADREAITRWFQEQCLTPRATRRLEDHTLPTGMEQLSIFTVPMRPDMVCGGKLAKLQNVRVEVQGSGSSACAVRLGPADALARIDPRFVRDWFSDPSLGARASALLEGWDVPNYRHIGMVDGIRIAVVQEQLYSSNTFFLVVDGCGHLPEPEGQTSEGY